MREAGLAVDAQTLHVSGRVLPTPRIQYGGSALVSWTRSPICERSMVRCVYSGREREIRRVERHEQTVP